MIDYTNRTNEFCAASEAFYHQSKVNREDGLKILRGYLIRKDITQKDFDEIKEEVELEIAAENNKFLKENLSMKNLGFVNLPTSSYVVKRLGLERQTVNLLCGTGWSGKTMFAQYLATCVSSGSPLFGTFPVRHSKVLHIDQEQHLNLTQKRYCRLFNALGLTEPGISRLRLKERLDKPNPDPNLLDDLVVLCRGFDLVIIDSLKKISQADENSHEIERVLDMLKMVAERSNSCILVIHHKGKGSNAGVRQTGRGHSSIYDSVDTQIDLDRTDAYYELSCAKNRSGSPFDGIRYTLVDSGEWVDSHDCTEALELKLSVAEVTVDNTRSRIEAAIKAAGNITKTLLKRQIGGQPDVFESHLSQMIQSGAIIEQIKAKNAHVYSLPIISTTNDILDMTGRRLDS